MIWLLPPPPPPNPLSLTSASCVSFSVVLCIARRAYWREREGGGQWELQRDVVYLGWPIAPSYVSPSAGRGGASQWVQLYTGAQINLANLTPYLTYGGGEEEPNHTTARQPGPIKFFTNPVGPPPPPPPRWWIKPCEGAPPPRWQDNWQAGMLLLTWSPLLLPLPDHLSSTHVEPIIYWSYSIGRALIFDHFLGKKFKRPRSEMATQINPKPLFLLWVILAEFGFKLWNPETYLKVAFDNLNGLQVS